MEENRNARYFLLAVVALGVLSGLVVLTYQLVKGPYGGGPAPATGEAAPDSVLLFCKGRHVYSVREDGRLLTDLGDCCQENPWWEESYDSPNMHPTWSPDRRSIAYINCRPDSTAMRGYGRGNTQLWTMRQDGSEKKLYRELGPSFRYPPWPLCWSRQGPFYCANSGEYANDITRLYRFGTDGKEEEISFLGGDHYFHAMSVSPGGTRIAYLNEYRQDYVSASYYRVVVGTLARNSVTGQRVVLEIPPEQDDGSTYTVATGVPGTYALAWQSDESLLVLRPKMSVTGTGVVEGKTELLRKNTSSSVLRIDVVRNTTAVVYGTANGTLLGSLTVSPDGNRIACLSWAPAPGSSQGWAPEKAPRPVIINLANRASTPVPLPQFSLDEAVWSPQWTSP